jgi:aspartyl-tRNA(Asn)/glutamyl-tRNA(Gln) amidotransferase subunit B
MGISQKDTEIIAKNKEMITYVETVEKIDKNLVKKCAADIVNKKFDWNSIDPAHYIEQQKQSAADKITDASTLLPIIEKIVMDNPTIVQQYQSGKVGVLGFFVGNVMKATAGKADPSTVNKLLQNLLK